MSTQFHTGLTNESSFWNNQEHQELRQRLRSVFKEILQPIVCRKQGFRAHDIVAQLYKQNLSGLRFSKEQGGLEKGLSAQALFAEELGYLGDGSLGMALTIHYDMVAPVIAEHGTPKQWEQFLKPCIRGELLFSHAVSEPGAGSDIANLQTTAVQNDQGWVLNGKKTMISLATEADYHFVLAKIPSLKTPFNMVILMVPTNAPGVSVSESLATLGNQQCATADIELDNVLVEDSLRIGHVGMGFIIQLRQFVQERIISSIRANAYAHWGIEQMVSFARSRRVSGTLLIQQSSLQFKLAELEAQWAMSRAMTYDAMARWIQTASYDTQSASSKLLSSTLVREVSQAALHLGGVAHYRKDSPLATFYCDARLFSISTGSDEMMLKSIAASEKFHQSTGAK
jgi:citronellyl-CoA dehydrogenase